MTDSSYYLAWLIYVAACTGICFMGWRLIKPWVSLSCYSVLTPLLVILLTPYFSDPNQSRLAPAILTALFEGMFGDTQIAIKAMGAIAVLLIPGAAIAFMLKNKRNGQGKNLSMVSAFLVVAYTFSAAQTHADEKLIAGTVSCSAEWNELCEDKKIISVPEHYHLCSHQILATEKSGDSSYQVVASDQKSITIYFRSKGNQDRLKPKGASIKLNVDLSGVKETETCDENISESTKAPETPTPPPSNEIKLNPEIPVVIPEPKTADANMKIHACACSQWLNWMKVEHCLTKEKRDDRPPCDSYQVTIHCVTSKDECRTIQKDNCPQIVGLNQSTSLKRLFVEDSPYCQK